mmetsp:Transcript_2390/g.7145  ORF Transcript_2390/g.7145 Transcript_2390/m.7145 type:complete len:578 (+) Transcript_2390:23-1756(+)
MQNDGRYHVCSEEGIQLSSPDLWVHGPNDASLPATGDLLAVGGPHGETIAVCRGRADVALQLGADDRCCMLSRGIFETIGICSHVELRSVQVCHPAVKVVLAIQQNIKWPQNQHLQAVGRVLFEGRRVRRGSVVSCMWNGFRLRASTVETHPEGVVLVTEATTVEFTQPAPCKLKSAACDAPGADALSNILKRIHSQQYSEKCVLITGVSGSGKTFSCRAAFRQLSISPIEISVTDLLNAESGVGERVLRSQFCNAVENAPSVLFLEHVDALRGDRRILSALNSNWALLHDKRSVPVAFVATADSAALVSPALFGSSRLFHHVEIHSPSSQQRHALLQTMCRPLSAAADDISSQFAARTAGFSPADLQRLVAVAFERHTQRGKTSAEDAPNDLQSGDVSEALARVWPSALSACRWWRPVSEPRSTFYGFERERSLLENSIHLELFMEKTELGHSRGALVVGASGTGKTCLLANAIKRFRLIANVVAVSAAEVVSSAPGETERAIRDLFSFAKSMSPCILVIESIEVLAPRRGAENLHDSFRRVLTTLLVELDGFQSKANKVEMRGSAPVLLFTSLLT